MTFRFTSFSCLAAAAAFCTLANAKIHPAPGSLTFDFYISSDCSSDPFSSRDVSELDRTFETNADFNSFKFRDVDEELFGKDIQAFTEFTDFEDGDDTGFCFWDLTNNGTCNPFGPGSGFGLEQRSGAPECF
jgi:hypothetical protein